MNLKGTLPILILRTLERGPNHGYRIVHDIEERSRGVIAIKEGSLYPVLHHLEQKGLIRSSEKMENGRVRVEYRLTDRGRKELAKDCEAWKTMAKAISRLLA